MNRRPFALFFIAMSLLFVFAVPTLAFADPDVNGSWTRLSSPAVSTGTDNGYSEDNEISWGDPHFGWELGYFYVTGYSQVTQDSDGNALILKNVGDEVNLWFYLAQDIDHLDGRDDLAISDDTNGYDKRVGIDKTDFGRGMLIVKHTDYHNSYKDAGPHVDYLSALGSQNSTTNVELCEEGDYEVILDYEIVEGTDLKPFGITLPFEIPFTKKYTNYRISFKFSVRDADSMVYPRDAVSGAVLPTDSYAEQGFYIDTANSKYLDIDLKQEVLKEGVSGTVLDTKMNSRVSPDDEKVYSDEGIYTITATNRETGLDTKKVIYVGRGSLLKTCVETGRSIDEVLAQQAKEREIEDAAYEQLATNLSDKGMVVDGVKVSYLPKDYLDKLDYNSKENIYFGYTLSDISQLMEDQKYVFSIDELGNTVVEPFENYDDSTEQIMKNVAIGGGVIVVCVTASAVAPVVGAPTAVTAVLVCSAKGAAIGAISGALIGGAAAALIEGVETGDPKAALKAAALEASKEFKVGAIVGGVTGGLGKLAELGYISRNGLTLSEAAKLQEIGLPNKIISSIHSMDEAKIYQKAGLSAARLSSGKWTLAKKIDLDTAIDGMTNRERIAQGISPKAPNGETYELHHIGQMADGCLAILTQTMHRGEGSYKILHYLKESGVDRGPDWQKFVRNYWNEIVKLIDSGAL